ncbi:MAG TPA: SRPBCC family protein [Nitrospira sp.]|nr:SRPBCC family protein [Nitrospira sp.]MCW5795293.1 SRPBCC family protein [Nitrospira sp.]HMU30630.1 SRPBCC family protein [Nitrospira sp.]HMV58341.1 SRPBCC family protein [Nitrospira sp.]HMW87120.1 SRPBCC family protein [Nitrospira sp.]
MIFLGRRMTVRWSGEGKEQAMALIEKSIEVNVPVRTTYNQWTQFEEFPKFMEGVTQVQQVDSTHLHWKAQIAGKEKEWNAVITEQRPDARIAWKSTDGAKNAGVVTFHRLSDQKSKVMLQMDYEPEGVVENIGEVIGAVSLRVEGDLSRFKEFIERRGHESGAWRGEVKGK